MTPLIDEQRIAERVDALAREIATAPERPDFATAILVGAFVFAADLVRALARQGLSLPIEFLWLRSYGANRSGSDEVAALVGPTENVRGRRVLLIDGVLDRGITIVKARELLLEAGARSVVTAVCIDKARPDSVARADYAAFTGVSGFLVGYGMDDAGNDRGLPYIARVD